jgi:hypothetical protein
MLVKFIADAINLTKTGPSWRQRLKVIKDAPRLVIVVDRECFSIKPELWQIWVLNVLMAQKLRLRNMKVNIIAAKFQQK